MRQSDDKFKEFDKWTPSSPSISPRIIVFRAYLCILVLLTVAYYFGVTVTLTLTSDLYISKYGAINTTKVMSAQPKVRPV